MTTTTRPSECTAAALYVSLDLGGTKWVVVSTVSQGQRPRRATVPAGDRPGLLAEFERARRRFGVAATAPVYSCYEAGGDGFWLHRWLTAAGIQNVVVDSSSIRVSRRQRQAKTDRLDAEALVQMLVRHVGGERKVWSVVAVPSPAAEDRRQVSRDLATVQTDRHRLWSRIQSLLRTQGLPSVALDAAASGVDQLQTGDGRPLGAARQARLRRECAQLATVDARLATLRAERQQRIATAADPISVRARALHRLRGVGVVGAETLSAELLGSRTFQNGRQLGALVGLVPTPYRSDQQVRDQGVSRAGRAELRGLLIQLAWGWLRWQPDSALTRWYQDRVAHGGARRRRIGIVAVARKLLIACWHYVDHGVVPEGATLKS